MASEPSRTEGSVDEPVSAPALRLHPTSILFVVAREVRRFLVPGLLVWVLASDDSNWELWLMLLFLPFTAYGLLRYFTLRYVLASDELVLTSGLLFRAERHVPFARIHNVDLVRNPFHRLFGVAMVRIETASGSEAEAELSVLSMDAVDELRARIKAKPETTRRAALRRTVAGAVASASSDVEVTASTPSGLEDAENEFHDAGVLLHRLELGDLLRLGLIVNRGFAVVAAFLGISYELGLFERLNPARWFDLFAAQMPGMPTFVTILAAVVVVFLALVVFSICWTIMRLFGYELREHGDDLRIECGLLTRMAATVPRHRIQFVSIVRTPLHRLLGCSTIHIETAGGLEDEDSATVLRRSFVPVLRADEAESLAAHLVPAIAEAGQVRGLARAASRRALRPAIAFGVLLSLIACLVFGVRGLFALVVLPLLVAHTYRWTRTARWSVGDDAIAWREGVLGRRHSAMRIDKIQSVSVRASPFDRRWRMATLSIDTAGSGPAGHRIQLPYLEADQADALSRALVAKADRRDFRW